MAVGLAAAGQHRFFTQDAQRLQRALAPPGQSGGGGRRIPIQRPAAVVALGSLKGVKVRVEQIGRPRDIYDTPSSVFVAGFIGDANLFQVDVLSCAGDTAVAATHVWIRPPHPMPPNPQPTATIPYVMATLRAEYE